MSKLEIKIHKDKNGLWHVLNEYFDMRGNGTTIEKAMGDMLVEYTDYIIYISDAKKKDCSDFERKFRKRFNKMKNKMKKGQW